MLPAIAWSLRISSGVSSKTENPLSMALRGKGLLTLFAQFMNLFDPEQR
jgi:hypothetical protein